MKNKPTAIATGEDFYPRTKIINQIYRRLESGSHVFMAAPRRVGKTSIMYKLRDDPRQNFVFVYSFIQDVHDAQSFYQTLFKDISSSEAIGKLAKTFDGLKGLFKEIGNIIGNIDFWGVGVELRETKPDYEKAFYNLITKLDTGNTTVVLMIDELPDAIMNIEKKYDTNSAIEFVQNLRRQRQDATKNLRFIYTGSIGLPSVVKQLSGSTQLLNDLNTVEIPPLNQEEAVNFLQILFKEHQIPYVQEAIDTLLNELKWWIPFHLQLAFQELRDVYEDTEQTIGISEVHVAIKQILRSRNDNYFDHYYTRIATNRLAVAILNEIAQKENLSHTNLVQISKKVKESKNLTTTLEMLVFDGYIFENEAGEYRFNSAILRVWWENKKHIF